MSWPVYMPDTSDTHLWVTAVAVQAMQEAILKGPTGSIKAYRCNLHVLDPVGDSPHVTCMTIDDWHQAQQADPVLGLVIVRLEDGTLGQCRWNWPILLISNSSFENATPQTEVGHSV